MSSLTLSSPQAPTVAPRQRWVPSLGAIPHAYGTRFTVWAPTANTVSINLFGHDEPVPMARREDGRFSCDCTGVSAGARYAFQIDGRGPFPDPASRWQPDGVHGFSAVVDPSSFEWTDGEWRGANPTGAVVYELHVGTFSPDGTFAGVEAQLDYLQKLGITTIELMPVADFAGRWNWGYDGVDLFAPSHYYGEPDDLRCLVNAAHMHGIAVILDVVYNHLGPDGAYLSVFSPYYFSTHHQTPWGGAINLDGEHSDQVRAFLTENALHWVHEYHVDGLRLDATHALVDTSTPHFLQALTGQLRTSSARSLQVIAEDERNEARLVMDPPAGFGLDGVWSDDFHHHVRRAVAGDRHGYFADFSGHAADLAATIRQGWFYDGRYAERLKCARGTDPLGVDYSRFVVCLQNHDQVGNRAFGERLNHQVSPAVYRALSTLLLTVPETPLLFMGQEWAASTPFCYFTDHEATLGRLVTDGRRREFAEFPGFADPAATQAIPDPQAESTMSMSRLQWSEQRDAAHARTLALYRALLQLRRSEAALQDERRDSTYVEALDDCTVLVLRGVGSTTDVFCVLVHWAGGGLFDITVPCRRIQVDVRRAELQLTTADAPFALDDETGAIEADLDQGTVRFCGPGALVLRIARTS